MLSGVRIARAAQLAAFYRAMDVFRQNVWGPVSDHRAGLSA